MDIIFIGAGNLATRLAKEIHRLKINIRQIYSRTKENAKLLADSIGCQYTDNISEIIPGADCYIFSVKDSALQELISNMPPNNGLWLHTSGSISMSIFKGYTERYGVFYPLQTFSKSREVNFDNIPIILESNTDKDAETIEQLAKIISKDVRFLSSEQRKQVHIAAVFACNFTNHLYHLASNLLKEKGISPDIILPLIDETAAKTHCMTPGEAQTGPAIRYDENVINKHLDAIEDPDVATIYRLLSHSIHKTNKK
jgi:Uncharacterized conserved protein